MKLTTLLQFSYYYIPVFILFEIYYLILQVRKMNNTFFRNITFKYKKHKIQQYNYVD